MVSARKGMASAIKRLTAAAAAAMLCVSLVGCSTENGEPSAEETSAVVYASTETAVAETAAMEKTTAELPQEEKPTVRIGSLKGPTSMGLLFMMDRSDKGETANDYQFRMATGADELLPLLIKGELDIALVPANVASVLYAKTEGGVSVLDVNTLGVLYMVSGDTSLQSFADLKGRTIYLTGKGTTPDYVLRYLLAENHIDVEDVTLEYKSEATEVAAVLAEDTGAIGLLPQPFVTAACAQNDALAVVLDMTEEWSKIQGENGSSLVTGVTVVRKDFLQEQEAAVRTFMEEHKESAQAIEEDPDTGAALAVAAGIVAKEPIARKAIPECNITYLDGAEMKQALSGYLQVLFGQAPESVGGAVPGDDFYYISEDGKSTGMAD